VDGAARHLLQVINDILDLSKIEAGKMVLEDTEFELDEVLAAPSRWSKVRRAQKAWNWCSTPTTRPVTMRGDPTRLSQALVNLLSNAVKFTATRLGAAGGGPVQRVDDG
jgi:two-component system sensor histidine kinase/response regulator